MQHDEGWPIGFVEHLERSPTLGLMLVARCRDDAAELLADGDWFLSPRYRALRTSPVSETFAKLVEASIVRAPAGIGLGPVRWTRYDLAAGPGGAPNGLPLRWHDTWRRAATVLGTPAYRRSATLEIFDVGNVPEPAPVAATAPVVHARSDVGLGRRYRHAAGGSVTGYR